MTALMHRNIARIFAWRTVVGTLNLDASNSVAKFMGLPMLNSLWSYSSYHANAIYVGRRKVVSGLRYLVVSVASHDVLQTSITNAGLLQGHNFHETCVAKWRDKPCPTCRRPARGSVSFIL
jgi:hypothetical protein